MLRPCCCTVRPSVLHPYNSLEFPPCRSIWRCWDLPLRISHYLHYCKPLLWLKIKFSNLKDLDITRIAQNPIISPSLQQLRESLVEIGDRWAYNRGISAALGIGDCGTPGLRRKKMWGGSYYGNQNTRCGKRRYTNKDHLIIYFFSPLKVLSSKSSLSSPTGVTLLSLATVVGLLAMNAWSSA